MKRLFSVWPLVLVAGIVQPALAQTCTKSSPAHTVALLELYTSEGCNSCPPADKFVSSVYKTTGLTSDQVLPLSLHVDYWDYIGWKDTFANPIFTQRQRWLAELASTRTVYTPEVFVAGKELRNWSNGVADAVKRINQKPAQADIRLTVDGVTDRQLNVSMTSNTAQTGKLYFALVESGLVSHVKAGENSGVTLQHDYVVRQWGDPVRLTGGSNTTMRQISFPANAVRKNLAVAAFVQSDKGEVLQALSLPICSGL